MSMRRAPGVGTTVDLEEEIRKVDFDAERHGEGRASRAQHCASLLSLVVTVTVTLFLPTTTVFTFFSRHSCSSVSLHSSECCVF